jgi:threonine dehydrogenase-like Zn-dependent dehydrogenase
MKRDGATISLWQDTVQDVSFAGNISADSFDVLIVGGGITGITTGLLLQKSGKKCIIAEATYPLLRHHRRHHITHQHIFRYQL